MKSDTDAGSEGLAVQNPQMSGLSGLSGGGEAKIGFQQWSCPPYRFFTRPFPRYPPMLTLRESKLILFPTMNNRQREKTPSQRMREADLIKELVRGEAHKRKQAGVVNLEDKCPEGSRKEQSRDEIAKRVGFGSGRTFERFEQVWEKAKK